MRPMRVNLQLRDLTLAECAKVMRRVQDWPQIHVVELGPVTFTGDNQVTYKLDLCHLTVEQLRALTQLAGDMLRERPTGDARQDDTA